MKFTRKNYQKSRRRSRGWSSLRI